MKWLYVLMVALLALSVTAVECIDGDDPSDSGKMTDSVLSTKSDVQYGITDKTDTCVTGPEGVSASESNWLREYYCTDSGRQYEDVDCTREGFTGCKDGACIGGSGSNQSNASSFSNAIDTCGNDITEKDKGEQCDPPNSICFGNNDAYGQCDSDCQCVLSKQYRDQCGNGFVETGEDCEEDDDCSTGTCQSCKCSDSVSNETTSNETASNETVPVIDPTVVEYNETVNETENATANKTESLVKIPEIEPVDIGDEENFSETPGLKATSGISKFFLSIWDWFARLFS